MRAIREAHRRGRAGNFLHRHHMFQITKAQAAPFLLDGDAMQPTLPHFRPEVARKPILRINLRCQRGDAVRSEEHTSELQSLMRTYYAVFCFKEKKKQTLSTITKTTHLLCSTLNYEK